MNVNQKPEVKYPVTAVATDGQGGFLWQNDVAFS